MAQKITIRRVGTIFPALCLVVIVLSCFAFVWLSMVGVPDFVLRRIEQEALPYGITLKLDKLRLAPTSGLAVRAQSVRLTAPVGKNNAEVFLRKLQVAFNVFDLLQGNFFPKDIHLLDMEAQLPTGNDNTKIICLKEADTHLNIFNRGKGLKVESSANLQGIKLLFQAVFQLPQTQDATEIGTATDADVSTPQPLDLEQYIAPIQPWLQKADELITLQQWKVYEHPQIDIQLRYRNQLPTVEIKAKVPTFRHDGMHFRNASLTTRYENSAFTIDQLNFSTISPHTEVSLQGAYDLLNRRLTFNLRSTAAIAQIVEMIDETQKGSILSRLCADVNKTPAIKLRGQVEFSENYALNNISLRGSVQQRDFTIVNTKVDSFELSFLLSDGQFNIDNLKLTLPDGEVAVSALSGIDKADAHIGLSLPSSTLHRLIEDIYGSRIKLPDGLQPGGRVDLRANLLLNVKTFNPGNTQPEDLIPSLKEIQALSLRLDFLQYGNIRLVSPRLNFKASDILHPSISGSPVVQARGLQASLTSESMAVNEQLQISSPCLAVEIDNISADCTQPEESLLVTGGRVNATADKLACKTLTAEDISCKINHLPDLTMAKTWQEMVVKSDTKLQIRNLSHQSNTIASQLEVSVAHPELNESEIQLTFTQQEQPFTSFLKLEYRDIEQDGILNFSLQETQLPLLAYAPVLRELNALPTAIELPNNLTLATNGSINITNGQFGKSTLKLRIPELIRTPQNLPVNKGKKIPLDITLNADFHGKEDGVIYAGNVLLRHETGQFQADITGNLNRSCSISNGKNTIAVNIIDSLIDDEDAHSIMRDFRFSKDSQTTIHDIKADITYDNGISVKSFCKADIRNTEFLIGAIEDIKDAHGNIIGEKLRSDMGANPYSRVFHATCDVLVDVQMDRTHEDGSPIPDIMKIVLDSPYLNYDNRPWLKRCDITNGTRSSIIRGDSIVFDLDNNGIVLHQLKGKAYPAYAFGMFFAPLQEFMKDIRLQYPVDVSTKRCEFPISKRSQVPISGIIRAESATGAAFDFLGTTIPLHRFSGFVNLSDDFVFLDKMNARTWGGVLDGAIKIGISGENTSFDGQLTARNLDLQHIGKAYNTTLSPALCNASIRFRSPTSEVKDVEAYGSATIRDGNLMELGIFQPVGSLISDLPEQLAALQRKVTGKEATPIEEDKPGMISRFLSAFTDTTDSTISKVDASSRHIPFANHFMSYNIQNASLKFDILNGYLYTRDMKASGYNLEVDMNLRLNLDTLDIRGNLWPQISSVPTLLIAPITFLSDFLIDIVIYGNVEDIQWKFTLDRIMRRGKKKKRAPSVTASDAQEKR